MSSSVCVLLQCSCLPALLTRCSCACPERARDGAARLTAAGALEEKEKLRCAPTTQHTKRSLLQSRETGRLEDSSLESVSFTVLYLGCCVILSVLMAGRVWEGECAVGAVFESMRSIQSCFSHGNQ